MGFGQVVWHIAFDEIQPEFCVVTNNLGAILLDLILLCLLA